MIEMNKRIVVIGSGNVATHLALALYKKGYDILQVYSRQLAHAETLAKRVGGVAVDSIADIVDDADFYFISVKDDAIADIVSSLIIQNSDAVVAHTAGSVPLSVLSSKVAHSAVFYPMQTFTKTRELDFSVIPCFIEASDAETFSKIKVLAESISNRVVEADSARRKTMHLAAVFACNMVNHCYHLAEKILADDNLDFSLLYPLIDETTKKAQLMSPFLAQTGPMIRYDQSVMNAQKAMLHDEDMKELYDVMAKSIHERHS